MRESSHQNCVIMEHNYVTEICWNILYYMFVYRSVSLSTFTASLCRQVGLGAELWHVIKMLNKSLWLLKGINLSYKNLKTIFVKEHFQVKWKQQVCGAYMQSLYIMHQESTMRFKWCICGDVLVLYHHYDAIKCQLHSISHLLLKWLHFQILVLLIE